MMKRMGSEVAVVGLGLIGAAALRYLVDEGVAAIGIGPPEPVGSNHPGPFASHYDSGRITRIVDDRLEWAELARESLAIFPLLAAGSGIDFHRPTGVVHVAARDRLEPLREIGSHLGLDLDLGPAGDGHLPYRVPENLTVLHERAPAGHVDPRAMLRAQLTTAASEGAWIEPHHVTGLTETRTGVEIQLANGDLAGADRVLVAAGAYTGTLLPRLAFSVKAETTILARLDPVAARQQQDAPALLYDLDHPLADEVYLVPPVEYPDGNFYVKMGCNLSGDRYLEGAEAMNGWMRGDAVEASKDVMIEVLTSLLPDTVFDAFTMKPCLVTYTTHGLPYVDRLTERLFVAAGGNGSAAKSSDGLGRLAAGLISSGTWTDPLPAESFRAVDRTSRG